MNRNVTALILIVLAAGIYFTYTAGQITVLDSIQATNNQYLSAIDSAKKLIQLRDSVLQQYNSISAEDRARLDKIVPSNIDNIRLMIDIAGIASRHGITATALHTSADTSISGPTTATVATPPLNPGMMGQEGAATPSPSSGLSTVTVTFSVSTTYANFIAFLQDIERSLRVLDVTGITLSSSVNGIYTYGVTLNTYWLKQ